MEYCGQTSEEAVISHAAQSSMTGKSIPEFPGMKNMYRNGFPVCDCCMRLKRPGCMADIHRVADLLLDGERVLSRR